MITTPGSTSGPVAAWLESLVSFVGQTAPRGVSRTHLAAVLYALAGYFARGGSHSIVDALLTMRAFRRAMMAAATHPYTCPVCGSHEYGSTQVPFGGLERKCQGFTVPGRPCSFGWPADLDCVFLRTQWARAAGGVAQAWPPQGYVAPSTHYNAEKPPDVGTPDAGATFEEGGEE